MSGNIYFGKYREYKGKGERIGVIVFGLFL